MTVRVENESGKLAMIEGALLGVRDILHNSDTLEQVLGYVRELREAAYQRAREERRHA